MYATGQHAVVVGTAAPRGVAPRVVVGPRPYYYRPYYYRPYYTFYRPYYTFHPHVNLGFGLWVGDPFAYPYFYGYYQPYYAPYAYPAPYPPPYPAYPYPSTGYPVAPGSAYPQYPAPSGSVGVQPGQPQNNLGGVSFDITPRTAEVFVDGSYVGTVGQFTPTTQPLGLTPGRHTIEIRAAGYRTMTFDADVVAGQVIPYQGTMER